MTNPERTSTDPVNHPPHYGAHPSGVECITVTEHMNFCLGNAVKYIWRAGLKSDSPVEDLRKARWYLDREIARLDAERESDVLVKQMMQRGVVDTKSLRERGQ